VSFEALRKTVYQANMKLVHAGLVVLTWGNASGVDRSAGVMAIKPSGVDYDSLKPDDMVIVSLEDGSVVDGHLRPSSDTPTHRVLYRAFPSAGGVVHTHSPAATAWAQACRSIPCYGTTHADHFYGDVPVTRTMTDDEVADRYEEQTGEVIVDSFRACGIDPAMVPGVLVAHHGPFAWGTDPLKAAENAVVLESVADMAAKTEAANPAVLPAPQNLIDKHFLRKHGAGAYYGQSTSSK
jgi:L-ribulose-5-phosphate 4-epimerase